MPVDPEKLLALYIYSNNDEVQVLLKTLKSNSGLTYRNLLRQMIEEVSGSERLRKRVRAFYAEFGDTWKDTGDQTNTDDDRTFIRIGQSEETLALASALAFQLCGSGSLSEMGRLLIRFYASEGRRIVLRESTRETDKPKDKVVPIRAPRQSGPWHVTTINLDEETKTLLTLLTHKLHMKGNGLVAHLVEKYAGARGQMDMLREAVRREHELPVQNPAVKKRFNFTQQTLSLLEHLGYKLIGGTNASLIIRALIRAEADRQEVSVSRKRLRLITK